MHFSGAGVPASIVAVCISPVTAEHRQNILGNISRGTKPECRSCGEGCGGRVQFLSEQGRVNGNEAEGGSQPGLSGEAPSQPISFMERFGVLGRKN